ncbi:IQ motif containing N [Phyllostomus discolor]|uniref:IQ domain-containing protein N n=1 Tax=Phyllostomus discolor TaxID=89673 RepID=A0A7E6EA09_9CHIR|nr:IQ domain-containing protein N [Phyllostomus discolor]KAF6094352.1 IQ motif containing N [Phyllostomus discolor]
MQQATQLQLLPSGQSSSQPQPTPNFQDKAGTLCSQPQCEQPASRETPLQQPDKDKMVPRRIPRLRAVVESQAFKNVLVDEMDLMQSHAATLIQANWRGHRLRQKLTSQMLAAKAIQEAWRRLHTRRLLRSGKEVEKKMSTDEGDIPYHPPQQVRFQPAEEGKLLPAPPVMVSRETQAPSAPVSAACTHQLTLGQPPGIPQPGVQAPCATGGPNVTFQPQQTVSMRLPCPASPDAKNHPHLPARTIRSTSLIHTEGDTMRTKQVITRANKGGALGPPPCGRCAQELHRPLKTQTQGPVEAEVLKAPPQTGQASVMTKTPLQSCLASMMNKTLPHPCPAPTVTITKTPPQVDQATPVVKTPLQSCLAAILNKNSAQPCPVPSIMITKTPPEPCLVAPKTKTPAQMRPTASMTNTASQTQPAAMLAKISPQICLLTSMIKPPAQTCPVPMVAKTQPQTCQVPVMPKTPPQTCQVPMITKTRPQTCPSATMAKTPLQTCPVATMAQTPSQTLPGASMTKIPPQTRLAAMITKTPAQLRSMATILRTLCQTPSAAGNLKASPPAVVEAGIPNTSSHTCLNRPKAKAVVTGRQTAGMVKVSSHSHLTEGKVKYCPPPHLGAGAPKALARPSLEGEKMKAFYQKQVKTATMSNTSVAKDRSKVSSQAQLKKDVVKVQSKVYTPVEMNVVLPQAQLGTRPAKALPQAQMATCSTPASSRGHLFAKLSVALPQANLGTCMSKPPPQAHLPAKLSKARTLAHQGTCPTKTQSRTYLTTGVIKVQSQADLPTRQTKAQSQAPLVPETAKCPYTAHQATEEGKTQSQPPLAGFKASARPCQQAGPLGTLFRAKPEDRLTQLPAHGYAQGKAPQGPHQEASETQSMLVPLLASSGHLTCNVESCGDSGTAWAQPSTTSPAVPCQEELVASQLASLCAELAAVLGSQDDLRDLLAKALSQGEVRAALNQALSKEVLGTMMAKVLPQGMLGTALVKALSWGELGATLSRALSRGELRAELTKAMQGKLGDMLSKALTEEEWATLNQALCQGELGAILSQSLSQAALRSGLILPKAASKTLESGMMVTPAPVEVTYRGTPSAAWAPTLGCVRPQTSKGPVDAGVVGGQAWKPAVPSVAVRPMNSAEACRGAWAPAGCTAPWDAMGSGAVVDPRRLGELVASVQTVEKIIVQAVITIQACARGYLVRRTIRVWHRWAVIIQAAWRGHCTRRNLAQLCRAATVIQATWRGYFTRRRRAQQMLLPATWAGVGNRVRSTSNHRCFQSCQPKACTLCQSLSPRLGSLPSAVMLVGSSPRTCHMCGQTLPTRVVQGMGQGSTGQAGTPRRAVQASRDTQLIPQSPRRQLLGQNKAAIIIQSAWRGFIVRRRLRQQQVAAKMLQATWRGHYTRASLTTDALLGPAAWDSPQNMQWPGV